MKRLFLLVVVLLVSECASSRKAQLQEFYRNLDSSVNIMTYDQAIMTWGQPVSITPGEAIFIAVWGEARSGQVTMPSLTGRYLYTIPVSKGWELRLSFDKTTKKMVYWNYREW